MGFLKNIIKSASPIAGAIIDTIDSNQSKEYIDDDVTFESVLKQIDELIDKDLYDEAIRMLDETKSLQLLESNSDFWLYYFEKAKCLYCLKNKKVNKNWYDISFLSLLNEVIKNTMQLSLTNS